jgi:hypothetical protein
MDDLELAERAFSRPWWQHSLARDEYNRRFELWIAERDAKRHIQEQQPCPLQKQATA